MTKGKARPEKAEAVNEPTQFSQDVAGDIAAIIDKAGETGITKEEIYERLAEKFPHRSHDALHAAVNTTVPNRISREHFVIEKTDDGRYRRLRE